MKVLKGYMPNVKIIPLGGISTVTQNMFVYEYDDELLIVDCGIGFPDTHMPGVDLLIPDIAYLHNLIEQGKTIVGMLLTHGHEDHIGAAPYLLPELPEFPIFASPLTAGFTQKKLDEKGVTGRFTIINDTQEFSISKHFSAQAVRLTHSVPDTRHFLIKTPKGNFYHGSDYKLDTNPIDGKITNTELITQFGNEGVLSMTIDCLRVEQANWSKSESTVGPVIEQTMRETTGKYIMTLMSSHIHRIQQTIDAAKKMNRKVVFVGRSVEQNIEVALSLGLVEIPREMMVDKKFINDFDDSKVCVIIAGSQGQEGSSLMRAVYGEHQIIQIKPQDTVVFSATAIPGNEVPYYGAIDELSKNGVHVLYPDILPGIHQSGHASTPEQKELVTMVKPKYIMPVGGADRHRYLFYPFVAESLGYDRKQILTPDNGEIIEFTDSGPRVTETIVLRARIVDGLGIGDVGPMVLSDRRALSEAGIIVLIVPKVGKEYDLRNIEVVSRGFVFMKEAEEVIDFIKRTTAEIIVEKQQERADEEGIKRTIEKRLARKLFKVIRREPLIMTVFMKK